MGKRKLPPRGSESGENIIHRFRAGERETLAKELKYASTDSFVRSMRETYGIRASELDIQVDNKEPERHPVVNLPSIKLLIPKVVKHKGDEEIAILHASDGHADKITKSFNKEIYRKRMEQMFRSAMTIINLHRNMYPINKLVIFNTGDNIQGENPHQGSTVGEVSMGARDQVKKLAAPMWNDVLGSFKQHFNEVEFHGVPGNHGHDKLSPETSSYDLFLYDILEAGIGQHDGINIHVHEDWWAIVELFGFLHFLFHGDGIPCQQGVPFFALDRKLKSWHMQYGGFRYAWSGHFHKAHYNEVSSVLGHFMCASLASDDEWALKKLGISSEPSQGLYGLHPIHGITWRYKLDVEPKRGNE